MQAARLTFAGKLRIVPFLLLLLTLLASNSCRETVAPGQITVAAASDLGPAFQELGGAFEGEKGIKVVFSFGSTGMLTQQIDNGAPMDLFAAANISYVEELEKKGRIVPDTKATYARGRIALWTRKGAGTAPQTVADLLRPEIKRVAIANPDHAPYGLAAMQALQTAGIWETVKPKLIYGDNIRQTLQFAETGNVDVAIVAVSLITRSDGQWSVVPAELHQPLNQGLAVIKGSKHEREARLFANYVLGSTGRRVLQKYGFELPSP